MAKKRKKTRSKQKFPVEADLASPDLYINRELSWLEFNDRVLREGLNRGLPLLERLKFLSIVSSNLDEFFQIRVAGLRQQVSAGARTRDICGLRASEQLERISARVHRMVKRHTSGLREVIGELAKQGLCLLTMDELDGHQQAHAINYFTSHVLPVLTPLAAEELQPFPLLRGLELNVAVLLNPKMGETSKPKVAIVPVPKSLERFLKLRADEIQEIIRIEDLIAHHVGLLFEGHVVVASTVFRTTRDADVAVDDDDVSDLLEEMNEKVHERRRRAVVRLEISADADQRLKEWLMQWTQVDYRDVYEIDGMLDARALMDIATAPGFRHLKLPEWRPQEPQDLVGAGDDLWRIIQHRDILLCHPYESFDPVMDLLNLASVDPDVLAIKQTLYRTSENSPIIDALAHAAENGKEVTVLVELKARFDEARNVTWARRLEDAGCHVIYGIAGLKTHAKVLLILRQERGHGIRRYLHLSTGNYNDRTAKLYSDIGLLTCNRDLTADASAFCNLLTGYSEEIGWKKLAIAPTGLRQRFFDMIEREIGVSTLGQPGLIIAKINSLQDKGICQALYRASQKGVRVRLNVRGICCLRPDIQGVSENIEVISIVDRYLEHARVFYFRNGGHEEIYLSSADWMGRNLDRRLEILFPVVQPDLVERLLGMLETYFADNVKAWRLKSDGTYVRVKTKGKPVRAQEKLYNEAVAAASSPERAPVQYRSLRAKTAK
ncbi:MAG: polyphosphate kinase 1 [Planctomycetes bacterium]|nr:polyphosphate kinase 1 [Planctomycetota bacterium]